MANSEALNRATLRLFNAIQVDDERLDMLQGSTITLRRTLEHGYLLGPGIVPHPEVLDTIEDLVGISGKKTNAAFHKSWSVIRDTPQEELWLQAAIHYFTTYGFKALGVYSEDAVYIPNEKLDLPDVTENIPLTVIKGLSELALLHKIATLDQSGVALHQTTLADIMTIVEENEYEGTFVPIVQNRELKTLLQDHYGIVPSDPVEFLRYMISRLTDESLLIKNPNLINKLKEANGKFLDELMMKAPDNLASIFFRFKPLFLAMKSASKNKRVFNRLRKQANYMHRPMEEDYLNSVTHRLKTNTLSLEQLNQALERVNIFRKVRLGNALHFRTNPQNESILYRIRNGKGWSTGFNWPVESIGGALLDRASWCVFESIKAELKPKVEGKTIYIPENINYPLPSSEKQFTGFVPLGTSVSVPQDMIVGIHWYNLKGKHVDLDLSLVNLGSKIGWDSNYRTDDNRILFSGDLTSAPRPKGASELFYISAQNPESYLLMLNYYNYDAAQPVDARIFVGSERAENIDKKYVFDVNNLVTAQNVVIDKQQSVLGLVSGGKFYFSFTNLGQSITSRGDEYVKHTLAYLKNSLTYDSPFNLFDILTVAGANVVSERPDGEYIDLSPENLDKTTILDLIR